MTGAATPNKDLKRWLLVTIGGIVIVVAGLAWDAAQHAADPDLAAQEGPLTLTNPSHALAAVGLLGVVVGLLGAAWTVWHPSFTSARAKAAAAVGVLGVISLMLVGGAWAVSAGGHDHGDNDDHDQQVATNENDDQHVAGSGREARAGHQHPTVAPYEQRYADASEEERAAADALVDETRSSLNRYVDVAAATADGYLAPSAPNGPMHHYRNPALVRDGEALDPDRPDGLVFHTVDGRPPQLIGAFFVAPRGTPAPAPAGDLVVWHSHSPDCPDFLVTDENPCTDTVRMLHVWTADEVDLVRRGTGETVAVRIEDPFGAPFRASIAPIG